MKRTPRRNRRSAVSFAVCLFSLASIAWAGDANIFSWLEDKNVGYRYSPSTRHLSVNDARLTLELVAGSPRIIANKRVILLDRPPVIRNGAILVSPATILALNALISDYAPQTSPPQPSRPPQMRSGGKERIDVIVIDAGHGGKDPGAVGVNELYEKDMALLLAKELRDELSAIVPPTVRIVLTRETDVYLALSERAKIANESIGGKTPRNGLFVSLHMNASFSKNAKGFEVYFLTADESSAYARSVAAFENSVVVSFDNERTNESVETGMLINQMLIEQYQRESKRLAEDIAKSVGGEKNVVMRSRPVQSALFYVLKGALMPGALIEAGFITNPEEAKLIQSKAYRKSVCKGIAKGVNEFILLFEKTEGFTQ